MTPYPPPPTHKAAIFKNLFGAFLLIVGLVGLLTAAWVADPTLGLGVTSAVFMAVGYWLATSEA